MSIQPQGELPDQRTIEIYNIRGPPAQVCNNEGGFVNRLDDIKYLERTVIFGFDGVQYKANQDESLPKKTVNCIERIVSCDRGPEAVRMLLRISKERRNLKQHSLLFALAMLARCDHEGTKKLAYENLREICRIPTYLFLFIDYCERACDFRGNGGTGWGRAHRTAISNWYKSFSHHPHKLARLISKYKRRGGTSHVDVLRRAHPKVDNVSIAFILRYIIKDLRNARDHFQDDLHTNPELRNLSEQLEVYDSAMRASCCDELCSLIREHKLSREHCKTEMLRSKEVWCVLLPHMNVEAMIRNIGTMSELGLFAIGSEEEEIAIQKIRTINTPGNVRGELEEMDEDMDQQLSWRQGEQLIYVLHPYQIMTGWLTYKHGKGEVSNKTWQVNDKIVNALEEAYYRAFQMVEPTNKNFFFAVHMSGQMTQPALRPAYRSSPFDLSHAAATMMMVTYRTEENVIIKGFSDTLADIDIRHEDTLQQVIDKSFPMPYGGTDCALPMIHAIEQKNRDVDVFVIYTDNETVNGRVHAAEALRQYRQYSGKADAKLVVCSMAPNNFSIADQEDRNMLDVIGFDSAAPRLISEFIRFVV